MILNNTVIFSCIKLQNVANVREKMHVTKLNAEYNGM